MNEEGDGFSWRGDRVSCGGVETCVHYGIRPAFFRPDIHPITTL